MLRKLFNRKPRLVEVHGPSHQTRVMSVENYISKTIEEKRNEVELFRVGLPFRERQDHLVEKTMRRWIC